MFVNEISESEALNDWIETMDDTIFNGDENRVMNCISRVQAYRTQYDINKNAKVGEKITCPVCKKKIIKSTYQQVFCIGTGKRKHKCKDVYWNTVDDNRRMRASLYNN